MLLELYKQGGSRRGAMVKGGACLVDGRRMDRRMMSEHFDLVCKNRKQYQALIRATECHEMTGRVRERVNRRWKRPSKDSEFWNLVEEVGSIRLSHCHVSTISLLSSNTESLSDN